MPKPTDKYIPENPLGRPTYDKQGLIAYKAQPLAKQGKILREQWSGIAKVLADRLERASQTAGKKDWHALKSLVFSGGIAYDKAFPKADYASGNVVINLFGSMGRQALDNVMKPRIVGTGKGNDVEPADGEDT